MWRYPIRLKRDDNGSFLATSPDFPELTTFGDDRTQALARAGDAIEEAIAARMADREDVPYPSRGTGGRAAVRQGVTLPTQTVLKVLLYQAMRRQKISKNELAGRLRLHRPQIDRLLNVRHGTSLDTIDQALAAVGYGVEVALVRRAAG